MTYNSRPAQELAKWAEEKGKGDRFHDLTFRAYFSNGKNIAEPLVLTDICKAAGLDPDEAERVIKERPFKQAVDRDWAQSREMGIRAVPTFVAGNRRLEGAKPYETLEKLMHLSSSAPF